MREREEHRLKPVLREGVEGLERVVCAVRCGASYSGIVAERFFVVGSGAYLIYAEPACEP
jgi:hypothetical protein